MSDAPTPPERAALIAEVEAALARALPGPWQIGPTPSYLRQGQSADGDARKTDPLTIYSPAHSEEVATVWTYLLPTEANAHLIAHAPEWLAALLALLRADAEELGAGRAYVERAAKAITALLALIAAQRAAEAARVRDAALGEAVALGCYDCGLLYGGEGWIEAIIPDEIWARISPKPNGGGVLCITCIARRLSRAGLREVPVRLCGTEPLITALREVK